MIGPQYPDIWSNIILDIPVKVIFFPMRLTFKLMDFEKNILLTLMWIGLMQSAEGQNRTKGSASLNNK